MSGESVSDAESEAGVEPTDERPVLVVPIGVGIILIILAAPMVATAIEEPIGPYAAVGTFCLFAVGVALLLQSGIWFERGSQRLREAQR